MLSTYNNISLGKEVIFHSQSNEVNKQKYFLRRSRSVSKSTGSDSVKAALGAVAGTIIPIAFMMKNQGVKNPFKLKYDLKNMLILSGTPILGGVSFGLIDSNSEEKSVKVQEGIFQFLNASIPTWLTGAALRLCETSKNMNNNFAKIISMAGGILVGMLGAAELSNMICDPKDKYPDRKLTLKDTVANLDDMIGLLVLAKFPLAEKLHIDKLLPFIYSYCGFRAGKAN